MSGVDPTAGRVVVLAGPSGSGKSRLAGRLRSAHGWPVVRLDDFYRDGDDPRLPRSTGLGIVDWDDPASWDADAAVTALVQVAATGRTRTPEYDIGRSRTTGWLDVAARPDDLILAEGIFAAEIVPELTRRGLLHSAWCVHHPRALTFVWRLLRDLRERRKPPAVLVRRGLALLRAEGDVVRRQERLGARPAHPREVARRVSLASAGREAASG